MSLNVLKAASVILFLALIGAVAGLLASLIPPTEAQVRSSLLLSAISPTGGDPFGSVNYVDVRGSSYALVAESSEVRRMISAAGTDPLAVEAEMPTGTALLVFSVTAAEPDEAVASSRRLLDLIQEQVDANERDLAGRVLLRTTVVDEPVAEAAVITPDPIPFVGGGVVIGLAVAAAAVYRYQVRALSSASTDHDAVPSQR